MAGDWIKLEKSTMGKRELAIVARLLGVSIGDAFLEIMRLFAWADSNVSDGFVPFLSLSETGQQACVLSGLCEALASKEVGWLIGDEVGVTFVNWDRHNGKSAKSRALDTEKKRKQRGESRKSPGKCPDDNGTKTGPEKRREDNKELYTREREEGFPVGGDIADRLTFLNAPSQSFYKTFNLLPEWMRTGESTAWSAYQDAVLRTEAKHRMNATEAETHIFQRTKLFVVSDKGKRREYHWTAKTYFEADHFDDPVSSWEIVGKKTQEHKTQKILRSDTIKTNGLGMIIND